MKHKVNLRKNIIVSKKKKAPTQQTAVSLLTPPPAPHPIRHHELTNKTFLVFESANRKPRHLPT